MILSDLNLSDLKEFDCLLENEKTVEDIYVEITDVLRSHFFCNEPEYLKLTDMESLNKRGLYALGLEGCTHALLLNLFLKSNEKEFKEQIKKMIDIGGFNLVENYIKTGVISKKSIGKKFLDNLIKVYLENKKNDINVLYEDEIYIKLINEYYQDQLARIDTEYIRTKYGI